MNAALNSGDKTYTDSSDAETRSPNSLWLYAELLVSLDATCPPPSFSLSLSTACLYPCHPTLFTKKFSFVMKMERELQSNFGDGECSFNNSILTHNHELIPLLPTDFTTPFHHYYQLPSSSAFNFPTQLFHLPASSSSSSSKRARFDWHPSPVQSRSRMKLSDKTRSLQKLLPSDKKMDIATMLEEAHKYVRFLQAQVRAIQSMPLDSSFVVQTDCDWPSFGVPSGLGMLNRQQLLQVLVNSPAAQTMLYSQGFCVYSLEQLLFFNKVSQPNLFIKN